MKSYNLALKHAFPERMVLPEARSSRKNSSGLSFVRSAQSCHGKMMYQAISRHDSSRLKFIVIRCLTCRMNGPRSYVAASHKFVKLKG